MPMTENTTLALSREAMKSDAAAVLRWLQQNETWTLLDQMVTPLLGRSPLRIAFELCSAVIELPDAELAELVLLAGNRVGAYLGAYGAAPLDPDDHTALAALRGAISNVWAGG